MTEQKPLMAEQFNEVIRRLRAKTIADLEGSLRAAHGRLVEIVAAFDALPTSEDAS